MSTAATPAGPARQRVAEPGASFDITPTDEQRMLTGAVRDFAITRLRPAAAAADAACATPPALLETAADLGLVLIGVPEPLGGVLERRATVTAALAAEALAEGDMGIALACLAPAGVATALGLWGDADQQSAYLPILTGDAPAAAAIAIAEPRALFDPLVLQTRATPDPAGGFTLDGVKSLVPRAAEAELLIVAAQLESSPALFIVEARAPGIGVEPEPAMGVRAAATGRVTLERVKVSGGALLGAADPSVYRELVALCRLAWCALAVGTGQAVLDYVTPYVNERVAFGEPISNRQSVAFMVANIAIELDGLRLVTYRAASLAETGRDFLREVALARTLTASHGMQIGSDGIQLLGGHGYTKEHPVERWYRDLRAAGMMEGALAL